MGQTVPGQSSLRIHYFLDSLLNRTKGHQRKQSLTLEIFLLLILLFWVVALFCVISALVCVHSLLRPICKVFCLLLGEGRQLCHMVLVRGKIFIDGGGWGRGGLGWSSFCCKPPPPTLFWSLFFWLDFFFLFPVLTIFYCEPQTYPLSLLRNQLVLKTLISI